jgi:hypothetical protein
LFRAQLGILFGQTQHIQNIILAEYFKGVEPIGIKLQLYQFPLDASFEHTLYEAAPLTGIDFTNATKHFGLSFGILSVV